MRLYVDSADLAQIEQALATGYVYGVTTNPTILKRAGVRADQVPRLVAATIGAGAREIHLQTYSESASEMVTEGVRLSALDPARAVIKVPAVPAGYSAAGQLVSRGVRVTLTAVYTARQALAADALGASYIAVYLGRMRDRGSDALAAVSRMQRILTSQGSRMQILAASIRDPSEFEDLAEAGVATATLPPGLLMSLVTSEAAEEAAMTFLQDARAIL